MKHLLIGLSVLIVMVAGELLRARRRRQTLARLPSPEHPLQEHLSSSGRFKAVVYAHDEGVLRVEMFQRVEHDPAAPCWVRISGPSFVDKGSLHSVVHEALRSAGGERKT
jgi:hypothetical protein